MNYITLIFQMMLLVVFKNKVAAHVLKKIFIKTEYYN